MNCRECLTFGWDFLTADQTLTSLSREDFFSNTSFDNLLPGTVASTGGPPATGCCSIDQRIILMNITLIRLDQVERLLHLDQHRRLICRDRVNDLHNDLFNHDYETERFEEVLDVLRSLSGTLLPDLRS